MDDLINAEEFYCVIVNGEHICVDNVEFLNVEESFDGRDLMTFKYLGETRQSYVIRKYR